MVLEAKRVVGATWRHIMNDEVGDLAAMLTYYAIFAIFPFALFVMSVTLLVLPDAVLREGITMFARELPSQVGAIVHERAEQMIQATSGGFAVIGAALALWAASRGALALGRALNQIHGVTERRSWLRRQVVAIAVTLAATIITLVALALLFVAPWIGAHVAARFGFGRAFEIFWQLAQWIGPPILLTLVWTTLLYLLPDLDRPLRSILPGVIIAVLLWLGASRVFAIYVANFGKYERIYGTLGAVIVGLTWLWLTNVALLLAGEIDDALEDVRRERRAQPKRTKVRTVTREKEIVERDLEVETKAVSVPATGLETPELTDGKPSAIARRIGDGLSGLAKDHLELARLEVGRSVKHGVMDGVAALLGGLVALIGFAMLCVTAVVALAPVIHPLWLRMLLMSFVYLLFGGGIAAAFVRKLKEDLPPEMKRSRAQIRRTAQAFKQEVQHG